MITPHENWIESRESQKVTFLATALHMRQVFTVAIIRILLVYSIYDMTENGDSLK